MAAEKCADWGEKECADFCLQLRLKYPMNAKVVGISGEMKEGALTEKAKIL